MVEGVTDDDAIGLVDGYSSALEAVVEGADVVSLIVEDLDPVVALVPNDEVVVEVDGDSPDPVELTIS